jgi:DNA-binding PadR family transcriptional regulator
MHKTSRSRLEFALLGLLIKQEKSSGYDLRKIFEKTPMATFSDSPGAIYPALKRLEQSGLVQGRIELSGSVRQCKRYRISAKGRKVFKQWLIQPIQRADVVRHTGDLSLRFAFMESVLDRKACISFLESLRVELAAYIPTLQEHLESQKQSSSLSAKLAMQCGIMGYQSMQQWVEIAIKKCRQTKNRGG